MWMLLSLLVQSQLKHHIFEIRYIRLKELYATLSELNTFIHAPLPHNYTQRNTVGPGQHRVRIQRSRVRYTLKHIDTHTHTTHITSNEYVWLPRCGERGYTHFNWRQLIASISKPNKSHRPQLSIDGDASPRKTEPAHILTYIDTHLCVVEW